MQTDVQHGCAPTTALEMRRQRLEQPPEHERQRLEPVDRPFEIERLLEPLLRHLGPQRPRILATCEALPACPTHAQSRSHAVNGQRRQLTQCADPPTTEGRYNKVRRCEGARCEGAGSAFSITVNKSIESCASAMASAPDSTTATSSGSGDSARASRRAALQVPAIAMRRRSCRSAPARHSSSPIACGPPNSRSRPARSRTTSSGACNSNRGVKSAATSSNASAAGPSIERSAPNMTATSLTAVVERKLQPARRQMGDHGRSRTLKRARYSRYDDSSRGVAREHVCFTKLKTHNSKLTAKSPLPHRATTR